MIRRLSDSDVRSIFESLHSNKAKPPPSHLTFQIVPVCKNGLKLSPPSYEFQDGLYVLLKPPSKQYTPKVPSHLTHLVMKELPRNEESACPWSLSGPQFPQPTAIQQRYCYPKGCAEYSSKKGGALWTMFSKDGKEDLQFRLLHVYFSAKRSGKLSATTPSPVRRRRPREGRSPWRQSPSPPNNNHQYHQYHQYPAAAIGMHHMMFPHHYRPAVRPHPSPPPYSAPYTAATKVTSVGDSQHRKLQKRPFTDDGIDHCNDLHQKPLSILISPTTRDEEADLTHEELLTRPIQSFEQQPSFDLSQLQNDDVLFSALIMARIEDDLDGEDERQKLSRRLHAMHEHLSEWIRTFSPTEQDSLVTIVKEWANQLAQRPMMARDNSDVAM